MMTREQEYDNLVWELLNKETAPIYEYYSESTVGKVYDILRKATTPAIVEDFAYNDKGIIL